MNTRDKFHFIPELVAAKFVQSEEFSLAYQLGLLTRWGVLFYGLGGHGKTEMLAQASRIFDRSVRVWQIQMGIETTISSLYGGLDMKTLRDTGVERYNVKHSFLTCDVAILEEMLDAPPAVLASLKTTITSRRLINGAQQVPVEALGIFAPTNKSPEDVASLGPSEAATLERFPIRLEIKVKDLDSPDTWGSMILRAVSANQDFDDRLTRQEIAGAQAEVAATEVPRSVAVQAGSLLAKMGKLQDISPRTGISVGLSIARATAWLAGRTAVSPDDLSSFSVLLNGSDLKKKFRDIYFEEVELTGRRRREEELLSRFDQKVADLSNRRRPKNQSECIAHAKEAKTLLQQIRETRDVLEQHKEWRKRLEEMTLSMFQNTAAKLMDFV